MRDADCTPGREPRSVAANCDYLIWGDCTRKTAAGLAVCRYWALWLTGEGFVEVWSRCTSTARRVQSLCQLCVHSQWRCAQLQSNDPRPPRPSAVLTDLRLDLLSETEHWEGLGLRALAAKSLQLGSNWTEWDNKHGSSWNIFFGWLIIARIHFFYLDVLVFIRDRNVKVKNVGYVEVIVFLEAWQFLIITSLQTCVVIIIIMWSKFWRQAASQGDFSLGKFNMTLHTASVACRSECWSTARGNPAWGKSRHQSHSDRCLAAIPMLSCHKCPFLRGGSGPI